MTERPSSLEILAATFDTPDGASRAAGAVASSHPETVTNSAVVFIKPDGTPKLFESKDWGSGRGALVGGAIGLIGGPLLALAGGTIGVLAAKLRDTGFPDADLKRLGTDLRPDQSAVVFEIATDSVRSATGILESLGASRIVTQAVDADVAKLFGPATSA